MTRAAPVQEVSSAARPPSVTPASLWGPALILIPGLLLRIVYLANRGELWMDEAITVSLMRLNPADLFVRLAAPADLGATVLHVHPPLHYILLRAWAWIFGDGEIALRSFSLVCEMLALLVLWRLMQRHFGSRAAHLTLILMAVSPLSIHYSSEVRYYSLFLLLSVASAYLFLEILRYGRGYLLYVLVTASCLLTFYYGCFVVLTENLLFLGCGLRSGWRRVAAWAGCQLAVVVLFLPWAGVLRHHLGSYPTLEFPSWARYLEVMWRPMQELVCFGAPPWLAAPAVGVFTVLVAIGFLRPNRRTLFALGFWLVWLVLPLVTQRFTGTLGIRTRAFIFVVPAVAALASLSFARWWDSGRRAVVVGTGLLYLCLVGSGLIATGHQLYRHSSLGAEFQPLSSLGDLVRETSRGKAALVLNRGKVAVLLDYYLDGSIPVIGFANRKTSSPQDVLETIAELGRVYDELWLVAVRGKEGPPWEPWLQGEGIVGQRFRYLTAWRVPGDLAQTFGGSDSGEQPTIGGDTVTKLVTLNQEAGFVDVVDAAIHTHLRLLVVARFPQAAPFHGTAALSVDGAEVARTTAGSDFATVSVLEAELTPGRHAIEVLLKPPTGK